MSGYPSEWLANSTSSDDRSGVAKFKIEGDEYTFALGSADDYYRMSAALDAAFTSGREHANAMVGSYLRRYANQIDPNG